MSVSENYDLSGRVAIITGASSRGIGYGAACALAAQGAKVFLVARREELLAKHVEEIEKAGGEATYLASDVSSEDGCAKAVDACIEKYGRLDIMVLSAGISGMYAEDLEGFFDSDDWEEVLNTNLNGVYHMFQHGYPECAKNGVGSIVPILSM
ncbi:MAG: SDR family NAD(P)-dependent oxidoreductase, partial [Coriobacteriales bacterium]